MSALGTVLTWICAAVVTLPLAPCALLVDACCPPDTSARAPAPEPARSCCAEHAEPDGPSSADDQRPACSGKCCELSPYVPSAEQVVADGDSLALVSALPTLDELPRGQFFSPTTAFSQSVSLQVLHCQWRR